MSISIIAKTRNGIQVYATCIDTPKGDAAIPNYEQLTPGQNLVFIGSGSTNDLDIQGPCTGKKYVLVCIWDYDAGSGKPISWIVFDVNDKNKIVDDDANPYLIHKVTGNPKDGFTIVVQDNTFFNNYRWIILLLLIVVLVLFASYGIWWLYRRRRRIQPTTEFSL